MPRFVRIAALALAGALAACSGPEAAAPVIVAPTSAPGSAANSSVMTAPQLSTTVPDATETSTPPAITTTTSTSSAAPETTTTSPENPPATSDADVVHLDTGTVVYHGTTYTMPPEETTKLADELIVTFDIAPGVDITGVDIKGAEKAYRGFVTLGDKASKDPQKDWAEEFRTYIRGPLLIAAVDEISGMAARGVVHIGHPAYFAKVTQASPSRVELTVCNDNSGLDIINVSGGYSVRADTGERHPQLVVLKTDGDEGWVITDVSGDRRKSC